MRTRGMRRVAARNTWDRLEVSFWFAPAIMAIGALLLAWAMYWVDRRIPNEALQTSRFVLSGSVGELRTALIAVAATVLATAGVVFTLLTLPLSTVAAQYGSRLLRLFLGDRTAQFVLGMFAGTFVYCLAGALSILPVEVEPESPQLTATIGLYLMLVTFATLILLVQHVSTMLQAPNIAAAAGAELLEVVSAEIQGPLTGGDDRVTKTDDPITQSKLTAVLDTEGYPVRVRSNGYIQFIDTESMLTLAQERDLVIRLRHKPGRYVSSDAVVAMIWPASEVDEPLDKLVRCAFQIGNLRTPTQDIEYAVNQLTEMAVRAMSPAINDPFTAMTCLDHVGDGLVRFIQHGERGSHHYGRDGRLRLVLEPVTFDQLLSAAFNMLRHASCDNATVLLHMLAVIDRIGQATKSAQARQQLHRHVTLITAESQAGELIEQDRQSIARQAEALLADLQDSPRSASTLLSATEDEIALAL